jgi:hypothetical protein
VSGLPVQELKADRDKVSRSIPASVRMEAGQVWLPEDAPWFDAFRKEFLEFPHGTHDDFVDFLSYAVQQMLIFFFGDLITSAPLPPERPPIQPATQPGIVSPASEEERRVLEVEAERERRRAEDLRRWSQQIDEEDERNEAQGFGNPWHGTLPTAKLRPEDWI